MRNYVVGDIQGCYKGLIKLLHKAGFRPHKDKLWAVGDLVARGPDSFATMEYLFDLGPHFDTVLGNHDLHLIACAYGISKAKPQDKLEQLIKHKHCSKFIDFLLTKPLAVSPIENTLISHAGLYPKWSFGKALKLSKEIETQLQGDHVEKFLNNMYGNLPNAWHKDLKGYARYRFIVNAFTRMRFVNKDTSLDFDTKCHPKNASKHLHPWFNHENTALKASQTLLFGHWASLLGDVPSRLPIDASVIALDTGYVWGNKMRLYCLETQEFSHSQA
ncbi:MAG: bis(5'-nucleosyl)-tetraphosphatase (symmetrical) [Alphaproteobacteria bacterium]|jgi:bis(5'-nucleosyl)-tetraphosphatase (symmetrical)